MLVATELLPRTSALDNVATPWVLAAFVFALSPRRHLWAGAAAGACFAVAVLTKETTVIVLLALLWQLWDHGTPIPVPRPPLRGAVTG